MKLKTFLLGAILAFNVNAKHDLDEQVRANIEKMLVSCIEDFKGKQMILNDYILFCENEEEAIFYFPWSQWQECIVTSINYAKEAVKAPACMLIVNNQEQHDYARNLKADFLRNRVGLIIFTTDIKEHEGIAL